MSGLLKALGSRLQNLTAKPSGPALDEIVEGSARILHPKGATFYNPAQVVNRDLSILILRHFSRHRSQPIKILEALSATGLRSVRYFNEIPNVSYILANDLDPNAVNTIRQTVLHNGLDPDTQVTPNHGDAAAVMALAASQRDSLFDVVDLDPYGSAAPFLEPAIRAISDGGMLCVTCTDLPVLCGNSPEICYTRYAATPLKSPTTHEMAVRIVLSAVQAAANRIGRAVEPVLCAKIDFYVRLFVRVRDSKSLAQRTPSYTSLIFQCVECGTQVMQPLGRMRELAVTTASRRKRRRRNGDADTSVGDAMTTGEEGEGHRKSGDAGGAITDVKLTADKSQPERRQVHYKFSPAGVLSGVSSKCSICDGNMSVGGPIWNGPLIEDDVAESLLEDLCTGKGTFKMRERIEALITLLSEEVKSVPLFFHLPSMCKVLNVSMPPAAAVRTVLVAKGYEVSQSHVDPGSLKTTAPAALVWDILRIWARKIGTSLLKKLDTEMRDDVETTENAQTSKKVWRPSAGERILAKEPVLISVDDIDFSVKRDKFVRRAGSGVGKGAMRFPMNPERNWGPKARAGKRAHGGDDESLGK